MQVVAFRCEQCAKLTQDRNTLNWVVIKGRFERGLGPRSDGYPRTPERLEDREHDFCHFTCLIHFMKSKRQATLQQDTSLDVTFFNTATIQQRKEESVSNETPTVFQRLQEDD